jgi:hypothetical protein
MAENNKTCFVCGAAYRYCPHCAEFAHSPNWMNMYDTEECKTIDETLGSFWFKHITKDEALKRLKGINLNKVINKDLLVAVRELQKNNEVEQPKEEKKPSKKKSFLK